jgi:hypothetical protein
MEETPPEGTPIHYPDQRNPAEVRPGPHVEEPPSVRPEDFQIPESLHGVIAAAKHLRHVARHWKADPAWSPLKEELEAYEAQLRGIVDNAPSTNCASARIALAEIQDLLGHKGPEKIALPQTFASEKNARCPKCGKLNDVTGFKEGNAIEMMCGGCFSEFRVAVVRMFVSPPLYGEQ